MGLCENRLAQRHCVTLGVFCVGLCVSVTQRSVITAYLSVRPLSHMCWANTQGWEVNWKQDVATGELSHTAA